MEKNKKPILAGSLVAGAIITASCFTVNANDLTSYSSLGSGAELRSELLGTATGDAAAFELKCGEKDKKTADTKAGDAKATDSKGKEGKCGEGKCGEGKCGHKKKESKGKEGKCGEGKCGEKKKDSKDTAPKK